MRPACFWMQLGDFEKSVDLMMTILMFVILEEFVNLEKLINI